MKLHILLRGIVGSRAYGLDHHSSDTDRMAVYAAPTRQLLGLNPPPEALRASNPDMVTFELGRFVQLALTGNPTVTDLLWLPQGLYETSSMIGQELIRLRTAFLSKSVAHIYLRVARSHLEKLKAASAKGQDARQRRQRLAKTGRQLARFLHQGLHLHTTGRLVVRLDPDIADRCRALGVRIANGELGPAQQMISEYEEKFAASVSPLPDRPATQKVDAWLRETRVRLLAVDGPDVPRGRRP